MIACPKCQQPVPVTAYNSPAPSPCPGCNSELIIETFPALIRPLETVQLGDRIVVEGESSCFYHPSRKAVIPCDACGRFLCALCDLTIDREHLCPSCLESGRRKGKLRSIENRRILYDQTALLLSLVPMALCLWPSIIGGPAALYMVVRYWKHPGSIVRRSKARFIVAGILGLAQTIGWILFFITVIVD